MDSSGSQPLERGLRDDEHQAITRLIEAAHVVNEELHHNEFTERSRARLNNALIDVAALSLSPAPEQEKPQ